MRINCLCRSFSSSCAATNTTIIAHSARRSGHACCAMKALGLQSPCQGAASLHTSQGRAPLISEVFRWTEKSIYPSPSNLRLGFLTARSTVGVNFSLYEPSFTFTRSLRSAPNRTNQKNPNPNPSPKKGRVSASKVSQAKTKSSPEQVQAKTKSCPKQVQRRDVVDEQDTEDDEDFEDDEDEDFDGEIIDDDGADDDELMEDEDAFIDDMLDEEGEGVEDIQLGDGGDGGGVNIGRTQWGEKALSMAKGVLEEFGSNFSLYAFKTSFEGCIHVRLDKLSDRYGSPSMVEIESFSSIYGKRLEEAGQDGILPDNLALEVSSPGAERVVEVPDQFLRFKDLPMLVRYVEEPSENTKSGGLVKDSILELASFEIESGKSVWKLANVRANREQAGKGRGLTKKQKEWRTEIPLSSLRLVRLYMDI